MEAKICCAYNVARGCRINTAVTAADSAREPLKVLKVLVEGLARDSKSSLWLTPLAYAPQLARMFPFDLAYLDKDMKVLEAVALLPETPAPQFNSGIASALILPFNSLQASGTVPGDQIIVCPEDELEARIAEISRPPVEEPVAAKAEIPISAAQVPFFPLPRLPHNPFPSPQVSVHTLAATVPQATGFTGGMTASRWQISNSTSAAAVLERGEIREAVQEEKESETLGEIASEETEGTGMPENAAPDSSVAVSAADGVSELATSAAAAESAAEKPVAVEQNDRAEERTPNAPRFAPETEQGVEQAPVQSEAAETERESQPAKRKKPTGSMPAKVATPAAPDPVTTRKKSQQEKKKESLGVLVKRFLNCEDPLPERRSIIRLLVQGLIACTGNGDEKKQYEVRDVSPTGLYLRTPERWHPGAVVSLVLERKDATEQQREKRVRVDLTAVRYDDEGVGFEWLWPAGVKFEAWNRVHTKRSDETDSDYFLRELRLTRALAFVRTICPAAMEEMKLALQKRLSNKRVASAVEIALKAEALLGQLEPGEKGQAHPDMVRRVLENGSWTEDDWIRQRWGGLLVSSCSVTVPDTSNSVFIDLLAKLMPVHLHFLEFVCRKATERIEAGESAATVAIYCTSEELIEAVGSQSLARIHQTMGQLSSLGLLAESNKPSYVSVTDKVKTRATPTSLGLTMYARCNGHR